MRLRLCLIIPLLFTQLFIWKADAQFCNPIDTFITIQDNQSTSIQITVDGLLNNDLSDPFQGLCALQISFDHDQVSDLTVTLTSPSGQEITLIGPYLVNFPTTFADWSVIFTQCGAPASPDPGFPSIWTNEASWAALGDYNGTYYPYLGCLEDFNTGPVNGTWTLNITDNIQFDAGTLISVNLLFCDPDGIDCNLCQSNGGVILMSDSSYCQGDPALDFDLPEIRFDSLPNPDLYHYEFIRILNDTIQALDNVLDFTALDTGIYQLCGISFHKNDSTFWQGLQEGQPYADLLDLVLAPNSTFCADLSENCIQIEILPTDMMLDTTLYLCNGDSLLFEGEFYSETGDYFLVDNSTGPCGRSIFLHVENYEIETEILSDGFLLTCSENTIELEGQIVSPYEDIEYYWDTEGGGFLTSPDSLIVEIGQPGVYHFITIKNNCPDTSSITIVSDGSLPEYLVNAGTINCFNQEITIQLFPISPVSEVKWITPNNDELYVEDPTVNVAGIYTLELTGQNGCTAIATVEVDIDTLKPQVFLTADTLSCIHPQTVINLSSPDNLFQVYWPELVTFEEDPTASNPGIYHVEATGLNGCVTVDSIGIRGDFNFPQFSLDFDTLDCYHDTLYIDLSSPDNNLIYNWTDPNNNIFNTEDLWATLGGTYDLSITNEENCTVDTSITLPENFTLPELNLSDTLFIPCNEDFIQLDLVVLSDYDSLLWEGPGNFSSTAGNPFISVTGIYTIEVTGTNGCIQQDTTVVALPPEIPEISVEMDTINCSNALGTIDLIYTGDLSFSWEDEFSNLYSGPNISSTIPGNYMLTVTDNTFNCTSELIITLPIDTLPPTFEFAEADTITCITPSTFLAVNSEVTIDQAHWTGPGLNAIGDIVPVDAAGWYTVEVTGANQCISVDSIQIFESDSFIGEVDSFYIDCVADSIQISLPPIDVDSYTWTFEGNYFSNEEAPYVYTAGLYTLVVTTIEGCIDSTDVPVLFDQELPEFELNLIGELNCIDSSAIVSAVPGSNLINYHWSGPGLNSVYLSDTIHSEGSYYFTATGENMCEKTDSIIVIAFRDFPEVKALGDSVNCYDDDQVLSIDGDISTPYSSILWQGPDFFESFFLQNTVQDTGLYILRVEGSKGCYTYDSTLVLIDTLPPDFEFIRPDTISCFDESVELDINTEENIVDLLWTGNDNFTSTELPVSVNQAGIYWLMIQGENGCISTASVEVPQNKLQPYLSLEAEDISCNRVKIPLILSTSSTSVFAEWAGPNNYSYTGIDAVVKDTGMYYVLITDLLNGCQNTDSIWVGSNLELPELTIEDFKLGCNGNPISINVDVDPIDVDYVWSGPSSFQSFDEEPEVLLPGLYHVTVTRQDNGCAIEDSLQVLDEPDYPEISLDIEALNCEKDSSTLTFLQDASIDHVEWNGPNAYYSTSLSPVVYEEGEYTLIVSGVNGCISDTTFILSRDTLRPEVSILYNDFLMCNKTTTTLDATASDSGPGYSYEWFTEEGSLIAGSQSLEVLIEGEGLYYFEITNLENRCSSLDSIQVFELPSSLDSAQLEIIAPSCRGFSDGQIEVLALFTGADPVRYSLDNSLLSYSPVFTNQSAGEYLLSIIDDNGCELDTMVQIPEGGDVYIDLQASDTQINLGESTLLTADVTSLYPVSELIWEPEEYISDPLNLEQWVSPTQTTDFSVYVVDEKGCTGEDQISILVVEKPEIYIPNIFTPNGDGVNDYFGITLGSGAEEILLLEIFDRWGNKVHHQEYYDPDDPNQAWNGRINGQMALPGVYVYHVLLRSSNDKVIHISGDITLIR